MADNTKGTRIAGEEGEIEKSFVNRSNSPAALPQDFREGDIVELGVLNNGVRETKEMKVVRAELRGGRWMYQVRRSDGGEEEALHQDENGNDWFPVDQLEWPRMQ